MIRNVTKKYNGLLWGGSWANNNKSIKSLINFYKVGYYKVIQLARS